MTKFQANEILSSQSVSSVWLGKEKHAVQANPWQHADPPVFLQTKKSRL